MIKQMGLENIFIQMGLNMKVFLYFIHLNSHNEKDNGRMICKKEKAPKRGQMDPNMKVCMWKVKNKGKEFIRGAIYLDMKVFGQKTGLFILNLYFIYLS